MEHVINIVVLVEIMLIIVADSVVIRHIIHAVQKLVMYHVDIIVGVTVMFVTLFRVVVEIYGVVKHMYIVMILHALVNRIVLVIPYVEHIIVVILM